MSPIDVIQGLYLSIYERPADWAGLRYWAKDLETKGFDVVANAFTQAPEFEELYAGLSHTEQVAHLYENLLGRPPEPAGLTYWKGRLDEGATPADLVREIHDGAQSSDQQAIASRINLANETSYGELIDTLYAGYYDRAPDAEGRSYWVNQLQKPDANISNIIQAFGEAEEYVERFGPMTEEEQVNALYQGLFSRAAEPSGLEYWTEQLSSGALSLANIAFAIAEGAEAQDREALQKKVADLDTPEPAPEPTPEPEPEPEPSLESVLTLSLTDAWKTGSNAIYFELSFPSGAELGDIFLQDGGVMSTSTSISSEDGIATARYLITASNGQNTGTLALPFRLNESLADDFDVTVSGLSINDQVQPDTIYTYQNGDLVAQEPELLTLEQALDLETLPDRYTLDTEQPLDAGELTVAEAQVALSNVILIVDNAENHHELPHADSLFSWEIRDNADIILYESWGWAPEHISHAETIQVTNEEISISEFHELISLPNYNQGETTVHLTLEQALYNYSETPLENYKISPDSSGATYYMTVPEAKEELNNATSIIEGAVNPNELDVDNLLNWIIYDNIEAILEDIDSDHVINANSVQIDDYEVSLEQFKTLSGLDNFESDFINVSLTLEQALSLEVLPPLYTIDPDQPINAGKLTVAEAKTELDLDSVNLLVDGADNYYDLYNINIFIWNIEDSAEAILAETEDWAPEYIYNANIVQITNDEISLAELQKLNELNSFNQGETTVHLTLEQALYDYFEAPLANYKINPDSPADYGYMTVSEAKEGLNNATSIIEGAVNPSELDVDNLLNWIIYDSIEAILEDIDSNYVINANSVQTDDYKVSLEQFKVLSGLDNFEPDSVNVPLTLEQALSLEALPPLYTIDPDQPVDAGKLTVAEAQAALDSVNSLIDGADNYYDLVYDGNIFTWNIEDSADAILADMEDWVPEHIDNAGMVQVTNDEISLVELQKLNELHNFNLGEVETYEPEPYIVYNYHDFQAALNDEDNRVAKGGDLVIEVGADIKDFPASPLIFEQADKNLVIQGHNGERFDIDAMGMSRILEISYSHSSYENLSIDISGLNFRGGNAGNEDGGAIYFNTNDDTKVTVENSHFQNNQASYGGAISADNGDYVLKNNSFSDNTSTGYGGAVSIESYSLSIFGGSFENNESLNGQGGAIYDGYGHLSIENVNFTNNSSSSDQGSAIDSYGKLVVENSYFSNENIANSNYHSYIDSYDTAISNTSFDQESPIRGNVIDGLGNSINGKETLIGDSINIDFLNEAEYTSSIYDDFFVDHADIDSSLTINSYGPNDNILISGNVSKESIEFTTSSNGDDLIITTSNDNAVSTITLTGVGGTGLSSIEEFNNSSLGNIYVGAEDWLL